MGKKYKLHYFKTPALAESIKFLLHYGNIEYEANLFDHAQWPAIKNNYPFGKVPILEIDGNVLHQTVAICRYLAKQVGLAGENDSENLRIDMIVETLNDVRQVHLDVRNIKDEKLLAEKRKELDTVTIPYYFNKFQDMIKESNGFLVNGKLTWADLYFAAQLESYEFFHSQDFFKAYPVLDDLIKRVRNLPQIKKYLENRQVEQFPK